ncbi:hypothetical protein NDU88_002746 [Pleurodeles waltl]|uniref:Secreted protein n=1 Tax=Pleurodeles waltl TaxID=8319 RepID=A0AAV7VF94_PLEWA|nr:hypothetical protein NDU88_002746 [Pleurodeles waltl]
MAGSRLLCIRFLESLGLALDAAGRGGTGHLEPQRLRRGPVRPPDRTVRSWRGSSCALRDVLPCSDDDAGPGRVQGGVPFVGAGLLG